jgi:hypothetical protein
MKNILINFRLNETEAKEIREISKLIDIPYSQLAREALREKISELKQTHPLLKEQPQEVALPA